MLNKLHKAYLVSVMRKCMSDVPLQMYLDLFRKGCTEHHGLPDAFVGHSVLFHNASNLWFKSHVQHTICLIQDQVAVERKTEEKVADFKIKIIF